MARRHTYFVGAVASGAVFAALVVMSNNFYWGASPTAGGEYYLFRQPLPRPFGPLLWAGIKPLLLATPAVAAWMTYLTVQSWRREGAAGVCHTCGYDLTANVSGVCPACGRAPRRRRA